MLYIIPLITRFCTHYKNIKEGSPVCKKDTLHTKTTLHNMESGQGLVSFIREGGDIVYLDFKLKRGKLPLNYYQKRSFKCKYKLRCKALFPATQLEYYSISMLSRVLFWIPMIIIFSSWQNHLLICKLSPSTNQFSEFPKPMKVPIIPEHVLKLIHKILKKFA